MNASSFDDKRAKTGEEKQVEKERETEWGDGDGLNGKENHKSLFERFGYWFFSIRPTWHVYVVNWIYCTHKSLRQKERLAPSPFYPSDKIEFHLNRTKRNKRHRIAQRHREEKQDDEDGEEEENTIGIYLLFDFVI